jgi:RimJ/RimL family protein N-acetyltransferase
MHKTHDIQALSGIQIRTPRLKLQMPQESHYEAIILLLKQGIQNNEEARFQEDWLYEIESLSIDKVRANIMRHLEKWNPQDWNLPLIVFSDDDLIGMQHILSRVEEGNRTFGSGMWVGFAHQNKGYATEMGRAVLKFGFEVLHASKGFIGAWTDNAASLRVMEKLGYVHYSTQRGERSTSEMASLRMMFPREKYDPGKFEDISIQGMTKDALSLLGIVLDK